jgi:hypothetical protein
MTIPKLVEWAGHFQEDRKDHKAQGSDIYAAFLAVEVHFAEATVVIVRAN